MFIEFSNKLYVTILIFTPFKYSEKQEKNDLVFLEAKQFPFILERIIYQTLLIWWTIIFINKADKIWLRTEKKETTIK